MAVEIKVPALGESVTTAIVARWLKQPGESVAADEAVAELETDKVSVTVPAPAAGAMGAHLAAEGAEVGIGAVLGTIEAGAAAPAGAAPAKAAAPVSQPTPAPAPAPKAQTEAPAGADYDVLVIGSGPGGYVCAIRAAQLGFRVACVEKRETLGGTCLNIGCIPSKALLQSSEEYHAAGHDFARHGIVIEKMSLDLARMQANKDEVVSANTKGVEFLFKKNNITWLKGFGKVTAPHTVEVDGKPVTAMHIVIAAGSDSAPLPGIETDEKRIVTSTGALALDEVPKSMLVVGAGVIGLELGSVWSRLGAKVTVVEFLDRIVPGVDSEIATAFQRVLTKQGLKFKLGHKVTKAQTKGKGVAVTIEKVAGDKAKGGEPETLEFDVVLVAIGRTAASKGMGLEEVGVALDPRGRVIVDEHFATNVPGLYAIGDVITGPMLAHKAEEEGVALAELLASQAGHVNYGAIPGIIYTWPEVATVGRTEDELKAEGVDYSVGKFPFTANGRARAMGCTEGFVKILADRKTDRLLGAHILGPDAGALIAELVTALEFGASAEDVARVCHAHPTLSEAVKEAALAVEGRAIHI
ncbi:dihydrolipoyl dehydrogenase [Acidomonas methanolica]|uniref:Dihydrolipoyl dehydrogenase n=3 Tax=Acidomonas methanolica TaxID=437 RepID=A0A023D7G2_ACIMT|nr:dihydrolipoyl dehydrogenase [Acidomonas methanolica]MBU2655138.1 dihydrolipoyl dehydrogenase [Acidomonas methanolica]TCS25175.1 dihydrolipoamide dehydrogenase [Acidomonas methanolica]GAJ30112.1 dihydrolipoamide dehydrogenase/2-oxoglutarate dehydrogenase E3 component [Acidomonas methanolica NBRC 104435]GEK99670.1 dihydrolipoyl dehydrogenase [Acidomonas methanolica NBRC 104435]